MILLLLVIGVMGTVFFLTRWFQLRSGYSSMSEVERRYAEVQASIEEKRDAEKDTSLDARRRRLYAYMGLRESSVPLVFGIGFALLTLTSVLVAVGVAPLLAAIVSVPVSVITVFAIVKVSAGRRRRSFNVQLVTLLDLLTAQLRSGVGTERALVAVLPSLQEPMHGEIDRAVRAASSGGDLIANLAQMKERYPSRSLDMFLSALEIDRSEGHSIVPALEQASTIMKNAFTLQSEGKAELSSAKMEFYGVLVVVVGLGVRMILASPDAAKTWVSFGGVLALAVALGLVTLGIVVFQRIIKTLEKETE